MGCYVGFRQLKTGGAGSWIARFRDHDGKQHYRALGEFESFDAAVKAARPWFEGNQAGVIAKGATVEAVCRLYVESIRIEKTPATAKDAEGRFTRLVYGTRLGATPIDRLTTQQVKSWLNDQIPKDGDADTARKAKASANRNLATLKAALNHGRSLGHVHTDAAWASVSKFEGANKGRDRMLEPTERRALLASCGSPEFRNFVEALLLTGFRPGELAGVTAKAFDRHAGTLSVRGKTGARTAVLSKRAAQLFAELAAGKIGNALMLPRPDGQRWAKETWGDAFREAARKAGLPDDVVLYSLRHTAISEMIMHGMDSFMVATITGTSVAMIEKTYGHLSHDRTRQRLDEVKILG